MPTQPVNAACAYRHSTFTTLWSTDLWRNVLVVHIVHCTMVYWTSFSRKSSMTNVMRMQTLNLHHRPMVDHAPITTDPWWTEQRYCMSSVYCTMVYWSSFSRQRFCIWSAMPFENVFSTGPKISSAVDCLPNSVEQTRRWRGSWIICTTSLNKHCRPT